MIALATVHPRALDRHELAGHVHAAATEAIQQAFADPSQEESCH
jgi:hypothetical protein